MIILWHIFYIDFKWIKKYIKKKPTYSLLRKISKKVEISLKNMKNCFVRHGRGEAESLVELKPATLLKKRLWYGCFPMNSAKFSEHHFF